jgi:N-acetylglutamate synthase-like GNAT family acetyltransferase
MDDPRILIREAECSDLAAVAELYRDLHEKDLPFSYSAFEAAMREIVADTRTHLFLLFADGCAVSTCTLSIIPNLSRGARPYGIIENVVTKKECRGKGYAGRILEHALAAAWSRNCYKVMLLTGRKEDYVLRLYLNAGFQAGKKTGLIAYSPGFTPE